MSRPVFISDHALMRYIERVHGIDVEPLRKEIRAIVADAAAAGAARVKRGGFEYVIQDNTVTTVLPAGAKPGVRARLRCGKPRGRHQEAAE